MNEPSPYREPVAPPRPAPVQADRLGALRSTHPGPTLLFALLPAILPTMLVIAMSAFVAADVGAGVFAIVAPFAVIMLVLLGWAPFRRGRFAVALHQHGIVVVRGGAKREIVFADVDEVWLELSVISLSGGLRELALIEGMRLVERSGRSHRVPLWKATDVAQAILRNCTDRLLADARRALASGETLTFANVALTANTIFIGGVARDWDSIRLVRFQAGRVALFGRSKFLPWKTVRLDRVPHPTLFKTLVRERARVAESEDGL